MKDWYVAGIIIGAVSGIIFNLTVFLIKILGMNTTTPWVDISMILFKPPEVYYWYSQLYGFLASLNGSIANGLLTALLIKSTGRAHLVLKSFSIAMATTIFTFMVLFPALDYHAVQHNPLTYYSATICFIPYGYYMAYLFNRFFADNMVREDKKRFMKYHLVPSPARKIEKKDGKIRLKRPLKLE